MEKFSNKVFVHAMIIAVSVWIVWFSLLGVDNALGYVADNWEITLTMVFGSIIAGATSEGGGAIAFPVFTKVLHINPVDAKLFSLSIQSVGMTAASLLIVLKRSNVDWFVIKWASIGGVIGMCFGSIYIANSLPADVTKMIFTILATSFAVVLFISNKQQQDRNDRVQFFSYNEKLIFLSVGVIGGIVSSIIGTGIDIITFSVMVLLFRVCEKIATPTTVVLMAVNSIVGVILHGFIINDINEVVFGYWMAAIPVVVVGAPLGAILCIWLSRQMIVKILITLISIELLSSLLIIPLREDIILFCLITLVTSLSIFLKLNSIQKYVKK